MSHLLAARLHCMSYQVNAFLKLCVLAVIRTPTCCRQAGEFHSFVFDGPIFSKPLDIKLGKAIERDGFVFCDVLPKDYDEALAEAEAAAAEQARKDVPQVPQVDCRELLKSSHPSGADQEAKPSNTGTG